MRCSHGSTEAEIISVDGGLRMEGFLAFFPWVLIRDVSEPFVANAGSDSDALRKEALCKNQT